MTDQELTDGVLQSEIELLSDVVAGMADRPGPLTQDEVDTVLGIAAE